MIAVRLADLLRSYTNGVATLSAEGATPDQVLTDLDRRFPGIRFRIVDEQGRLRRHMRCFVNETDTRDLATTLHDGDELFIVGALSGG